MSTLSEHRTTEHPSVDISPPVPNATLPLPGGYRVELIEARADLERSRGRAAIREAIIGMKPSQPGPPYAFPSLSREPRVLWLIVAPNDLVLAIRARDFESLATARRDAAATLARAERLVPVEVHDATSGRRSTWLTHGGHVVLVGGKVWRSPADPAGRQLLRQFRHATKRTAGAADRRRR